MIKLRCEVLQFHFFKMTDLSSSQVCWFFSTASVMNSLERMTQDSGYRKMSKSAFGKDRPMSKNVWPNVTGVEVASDLL